MSDHKKEDFTPNEAGQLTKLIGLIINGRSLSEMVGAPDFMSGGDFDARLQELRKQVKDTPFPSNN